MKGGQLPDLPPEVKAARDTLAAWLNKQKLFTARALDQLGTKNATHDAGIEKQCRLLFEKGLEPNFAWSRMIMERATDNPGARNIAEQTNEEIWEADDQRRSLAERLLLREFELAGIARPDLSDAEKWACSAALLYLRVRHMERAVNGARRWPDLCDLVELLWPNLTPGADRPASRAKVRQKKSDLPNRLVDPRPLANTLRSLRNQTRDNPEEFQARDIREALLQCLRYAHDAAWPRPCRTSE